MRVLHVCATLAPRYGGPSNLLGLTHALARQGCDVSLFTTDRDEPGSIVPWRDAQRLPVPLDRPVMSGGVSVRHFRVNWPIPYGCSWPMATALWREVGSFDLVHIQSLYMFHGAVAAAVCRRRGIPYIIRPHGTLDPIHWNRHRKQKALYEWLIEWRNLNGAAAIHYTSEAEAEHARAVGVRTPGIVVGLGVDLEEYTSLPEPVVSRAEHPELADKRLVVFLGRITQKKGLDLLAPAFAQVAAMIPDAHLVIAGPDDEGYGAGIKDLLRRLGIEQRVTWTGMLTGRPKLALLRDADAWVLPSRDENFGIAVVEALAAGAPVLMTDGIGIHEAVAQAVAGLVVKAESGALAQGLTTLLTDEALCQRLSANGRQLALHTFSWDTTARNLLREYARIVEGKRLGARGAASASTRTI